MQTSLCLLFFYLLVLQRVYSQDELHAVKYDVNTFFVEVPKKNHFVMFYAPWCGYSQDLAPTWEQLAEMFNKEGGKVIIAKVDCTTDKKACSRKDVTAYPTLRFYHLGSSESVKYRGRKDLLTLTAFVYYELGPEGYEAVINAMTELKGHLGLTED